MALTTDFTTTKSVVTTAWRGERICIEAPSDRSSMLALMGPNSIRLEPTIEGLYATTADGKKVWDVIAPYKTGETHKLWASYDVPADLAPGFYRNENGTLVIEVLAFKLPTVREWSFHLDLWQNPWAVARQAGCEPWSEKHMDVLYRHLLTLADAGQKVVTTTIVENAWASQTLDPHQSMVKWLCKGATNTTNLSFDFSVFEKYVNVCRRAGIMGPIHAFSILPWGTNIGCGAKDGLAPYKLWCEALGEVRVPLTVCITPGSDAYDKMWGCFIRHFVAFLREKGWIDDIRFAFDERHKDEMKAAIDTLQRHWPTELGPVPLASAYEHDGDYSDTIHDLSVGLNTGPNWPALTKERREKNKLTTFYLCEHPRPPNANTFLSSPIHESRWIGWYAFANGFDGFLRWAYDSWPEDPLLCGDFPGPHGHWPAGDTFLCYPNGWKSRRLALLRLGIQDYEKLKALSSVRIQHSQMAIPEIGNLASAIQTFKRETVISPLMLSNAISVLTRVAQGICGVAPLKDLYFTRHTDRFDSYEHNNWWKRAMAAGVDVRDCPLSDIGKSQAEDLASFFAGKIEHICSSPYLRTLQVADRIAERLGLSIKVECGLSEGYHQDVAAPITRLAYFPRLDENHVSQTQCEAMETYPDGFTVRVSQTASVLGASTGCSVFVSHAATCLALAAVLLNCDAMSLGRLAPGGVIWVRQTQSGFKLVTVMNGIEGSKTMPWGFGD